MEHLLCARPLRGKEDTVVDDRRQPGGLPGAAWGVRYKDTWRVAPGRPVVSWLSVEGGLGSLVAHHWQLASGISPWILWCWAWIKRLWVSLTLCVCVCVCVCVWRQGWGAERQNHSVNTTHLPGMFLFFKIYFFVYGCAWAFSSFVEWGLLSSCGAWASHCNGFPCCRAQVDSLPLDHQGHPRMLILMPRRVIMGPAETIIFTLKGLRRRHKRITF